jgi:hypothetical protein
LLIGTPVVAQTSQAPPDLEGYTVIQDVRPNSSYLRLFGHFSFRTVTFEVRAVGNVTGVEYSTKAAEIAVPAQVSRQFSFADLQTLASQQGAGNWTPTGADTGLTLHVKTDHPGLASLYQHIGYDASNGALYDKSTCSFVELTPGQTIGLAGLKTTALNAHSSKVIGYNSYVRLLNSLPVPNTAQIAISDSATGLPLGGARVDVPANGTRVVSVAELERLRGISPKDGQFHYNLRFSGLVRRPQTNPLSRDDGIVGSHFIIQAGSATELNLNQRCTIVTAPTVPEVPTAAPSQPTYTRSWNLSQNPCALNPEYERSLIMEKRPGCQQGYADFPNYTNTPGRIAMGSGADGRIEKATDVDWYRVEMARFQTYRVKAMGLAPSPPNEELFFNIGVRIIDPSGVPVPGAMIVNSGGSDDAQLDYTATTSGTHFVEVFSSNGKEFGDYQVSVRSRLSEDKCAAGDRGAGPAIELRYGCIAPDTVDYLDLPGNMRTQAGIAIHPAGLDSGLSGAITFPGDVDWYGVNLKAGQNYQFRMDLNCSVCKSSDKGSIALITDVKLRLIAPNGQTALAQTTAGSSKIAIIDYVANETGTFYVEISAANGTETGSYYIGGRPLD